MTLELELHGTAAVAAWGYLEQFGTVGTRRASWGCLAQQTWALPIGPVLGSNWTLSLGHEEPAKVGLLGLQNGLRLDSKWALSPNNIKQ